MVERAEWRNVLIKCKFLFFKIHPLWFFLSRRSLSPSFLQFIFYREFTIRGLIKLKSIGNKTTEKFLREPIDLQARESFPITLFLFFFYCAIPFLGLLSILPLYPPMCVSSTSFLNASETFFLISSIRFCLFSSQILLD